MPIEIPDVVIDRLPVYARALAALDARGATLSVHRSWARSSA